MRVHAQAGPGAGGSACGGRVPGGQWRCRERLLVAIAGDGPQILGPQTGVCWAPGGLGSLVMEAEACAWFPHSVELAGVPWALTRSFLLQTQSPLLPEGLPPLLWCFRAVACTACVWPSCGHQASLSLPSSPPWLVGSLRGWSGPCRRTRSFLSGLAFHWNLLNGPPQALPPCPLLPALASWAGGLHGGPTQGFLSCRGPFSCGLGERSRAGKTTGWQAPD